MASASCQPTRYMGCRLDSGFWKTMPTWSPRIARRSAPGHLDQVPAVEYRPAFDLRPGGQAERRLGGQCLARTRLPDDAECLTGFNRKRDAPHRLHHAVGRGETNPEVVDLEQRY